jgi:signal peptidase II
MSSKRLPSRVFALALLFMTVGCDRVTKRMAVDNLADKPPQSYLGGVIRLEYAENPGAFLSVGSELPEWARVSIFRIGVGVALLAVGFVALKQHWVGIPLSGASLVVAGGVSNLVDRFLQGNVVDFMSVGIGSVRTGIFNVADVAILLGGALIAFLIRGPKAHI